MMTAIEVENLQEAFVLANKFGIEVSLGLVLFLAFVLVLIVLFSPKGQHTNDH